VASGYNPHVAEPLAGGVSESSPAARERAQSLIGRTISDRYRIVELVAMGGMGAVYRAEHVLMRKELAIKVLHPETEDFPELVSRFEREAVAGAHISHPNVAIASDFGTFSMSPQGVGGPNEDSRFLVLEYIRGRTLRELIDEGPVPASRAAWIAKQVAGALAAVHAKGIVHRDVKPRNIMILPGPRHGEDIVKLIDFGLAKVPVDQLSQSAHDPDYGKQSLTAAGVVMGTVAYLAPEAALGMRSVGPLADLYSLGVILYEMLTGQHPFDATAPAQLFAQHRTKVPPPLAERAPGVHVPPAIEAITMRLLAKDPDERAVDAAEVVAKLDSALTPPAPKPLGPPRPSGAGVTSHETGSTASLVSDSPPYGRSRSTRWLLAAAAVAVLSTIGIFVVRATSSDDVAPTASAVAGPASAPIAEAEPAPRPKSSAPLPVAPSARERLRRVVDAKDSVAASSLLLELGTKDPAAFRDRAVQTEAAAAMDLAVSTPQAQEILDLLSQKLGTDGIDILYDVVARESANPQDKLQAIGMTAPTAAGPRARAILTKPDVLARATPAMRVAYELRRASCQYRTNLFPRAGKEGDDRALQILTAMTPPGCTAQAQLCCVSHNRELDRAIADIQARIRR
jgi:serine/threonine protein kinase